MSKLLSLFAVLTLVAPAVACEWDSDTLLAEASGRMDVVSVILGKFERNPPALLQNAPGTLRRTHPKRRQAVGAV